LKKRKLGLFASLLVLALAFPLSSHAEEGKNAADGYDYADGPFRLYLAELLKLLEGKEDIADVHHLLVEEAEENDYEN